MNTQTSFSNDARPGGILKHPTKLVPEAKTLLAKNWNYAFQGSSKSHKTAVLEEGMDYVSIGLSPEDSQMIDSQKFSVIDICRVFRVPLNLVQDHDRSTYSNVTEQNRSFVVIPWSHGSPVLNRHVTGFYSPKMKRRNIFVSSSLITFSGGIRKPGMNVTRSALTRGSFQKTMSEDLKTFLRFLVVMIMEQPTEKMIRLFK